MYLETSPANSPGYRYPGVKPFSTKEQHLFFGRDEDIIRLYKLISVEQLVLIYSKSGLGKSSILNAGVVPKFEADGDFEIINVRFGAWRDTNKITPVATLLDKIRSDEHGPSFLNEIVKDDNKNQFWFHLKSLQLERKRKNILIILDQFEELFTYPDAEIYEFKKQLAEVLNVVVPQRYRNVLEENMSENPKFISNDDLVQLYEPLNLKVVMAIRSDKMSQLNQLKDFIPNVLQKTYEINALDNVQAEDAILNPAYKRENNFLSNPFDFENETLDGIIAYLTKAGEQKIESFQLQIICQHAENMVIEKHLSVVDQAALGDINDVFENYYDNLILKLPTADDQDRARVFIEEKLIYGDKIRLSVYEGQILGEYNISKELLSNLVNSHLLRPEPHTAGGFSYELSHDTLVDPILKAKAKRLGKKRIAEEVAEFKLIAEREVQKRARERKKLRSTQTVLIIITFLTILSIALSAWAITERNNFKKINLKLLKSDKALNNMLTKLQIKEESLKRAYTTLEEENKNTDSMIKIAKAAVQSQKKLSQKIVIMAFIQKKEADKRYYDSMSNSEFQKTSFYRYTNIDNSIKEKGKKLLAQSLENKDKLLFRKTLNSYEQLYNALDTVSIDPDEALRMITKVRQNIKNEVVEIIGLKIANEYVFSTQKIVPEYEANTYHTLAFSHSKDKRQFAYGVEGFLVEGKITENDSLVITNKNNFSKSPHIESIAFRENGEIIGVNKNNLLFWKNGIKNVLDSLPGNKDDNNIISPDGKLLLQNSENADPILYSLGNVSDNKILVSKVVKFPINGLLYAFSPDSKSIAIVQKNKCNLYNFKGELLGTFENKENNSSPKYNLITAVSFTIDSRKIVLGTYGEDARQVIVWNPLNNEYFSENFSDQLEYISHVSISPDGKKLLAGSTFNSFDFVYSYDDKTYKRLPKDSNIVYRDFIDDTTIVTVDYYGNIGVWKVYPDYDNFQKAVSSIKLPRTLTEKLAAIHKKLATHSTSYERLILSNKEDSLLLSGQYYYVYGRDDKEFLNKSKQFYLKLQTIGEEKNTPEYLYQLIKINEDLNEIDSINYFGKVNRLKENVKYRENLLLKDSSNPNFYKNLSNDYGSLAWYQLFIKDFNGAIQSASRGISIDGKNDWIYTNLALGYLLTGQFTEAESIYAKYRDKRYSNNTRVFKIAFLSDLETLEEEGIITSSTPEIYKKVIQIKAFLKN